MSGHSKWSTIKHKKAAKDAKKGKLWSRIIKEITIAARDGGPDPDNNPSLRTGIQNAKGANLPKETVERAIKKGSGAESANLQEATFEGYASNGIAVFVETTSDNNRRTVADVRAVFSKYNGELGTNGSLSFLFERKGVFTIEAEKLTKWDDLEELEMDLIDGGLEEMEREENIVTLYVSFDNFGEMQKTLEELNIEVKSAELQRIPNNYIPLEINKAKSVLKLIEKMEEVDDVTVVYHNLEMTDELIKALNEE